MKNITKLLSLTASILMLASVASVGSIMSVDASHGTLQTFEKKKLQYYCDSSLKNLNVDKISPCSEFGKASNTWTKNVPKLTVTKTNSLTEKEITVRQRS